MRWGETNEQWHNRHNQEWHPYYAKLPTHLENGSWVWREWIERRYQYTEPCMGGGGYYTPYYRLTPPT